MELLFRKILKLLVIFVMVDIDIYIEIMGLCRLMMMWNRLVGILLLGG